MSVSLFVSLKRAVPLPELRELTSAALQQMLKLEHPPVVVVSVKSSDGAGRVDSNDLSAGSKSVLCAISGYEEQASVMPLKLLSSSLPEDDCGNDPESYSDFVSIDWAYRKTPLNYVLCAAVAAGISISQQSEIQDNGAFYTLNCDPTPQQFLQSLVLHEPQEDLQEAAEMLYGRMPKSIHFGELTIQ